MIQEIESRCEGHPEYISLLNDCYRAYFSIRKSLLGPPIRDHIKDLMDEKMDTLTFARNASAYMMRVCAEEQFLFKAFFNNAHQPLA